MSTETKLTFTVQERAVTYARVSYDDRDTDGRNLAGQLDMGREYANQKGYRVITELPETDKGISGYEIDLPQLNRIREMAQAGAFDVLIVRELDRLSRNLAKQLIIEEELKRAGVRIEYVLSDYADSPEGRLQKHIKATVAEYEREKINERMVRGRRNKVKSGSVIVSGRSPYGYRLEQRDDKATLVIDESEARIVRLIFQWYISERVSIYEIGVRLTEMKVPTPAESGERLKCRPKKKGYGEWGRSTIQRILASETYCGVWHYGKKTDTGGHWQDNPTEHQIAVNVEPIVSRKVWLQAQDRREQNKVESKRNRKHAYLLAGRVMCSVCLRKMAGWSKNVGKYHYILYRCSEYGKPKYGFGKCDLPTFRADYVDVTVLQWLGEILTSPDKLREALENHRAERARVLAPLLSRLEVTEDLIKRQERDLQNTLDLLTELKVRQADRAREAMLDKVTRIEKTLTGLETQRQEVLSKLGEEQGPNVYSTWATVREEEDGTLTTLAVHSREFEEADTFEKKHKLIEKFDIRVTLAIEDGQKMVHVTGKLGTAALPIVSHSTYAIIINQI